MRTEIFRLKKLTGWLNFHFWKFSSFGYQMTFKAGKQYAIIGQNRSGKSKLPKKIQIKNLFKKNSFLGTLANLLCKLYAPQCGRLSLNGIPYELIPRVQIRDIISYVSQVRERERLREKWRSKKEEAGRRRRRCKRKQHHIILTKQRK